MCAASLTFESPAVSPLNQDGTTPCELHCQKQSAHKRKFTPEEDEKIKQLVEHYGIRSWKYIAEHMEGRTVRQIRERYCNYLQPHLQMKPWSDEEDNLLTQKYYELGSRWVEIAAFFPGRTDVHLKNRMKLLLRRFNRISSLNIPILQKHKIQPFILPKIEKRPKKAQAIQIPQQTIDLIQDQPIEVAVKQRKAEIEEPVFEFIDDSFISFDYFNEEQNIAF